VALATARSRRQANERNKERAKGTREAEMTTVLVVEDEIEIARVVRETTCGTRASR
jgi:hypothetical protein